MDIRKLPKTEFAASIAQIAGERGISSQSIIDIIEQGLISAYKRDQKERGIIVPDEAVFEAEITPETGSFAIYQILENDQRQDVTPPGFGRIAAQTAMNVLKQGLFELQSEKVIADYRKKIGTLVNGVVIKTDPYRITVSLDKETEGICPKEEAIYNETLHPGDRKLFLVKAIAEDELGRKTIILSRRDPDFIKELFSREVPEVGDHKVTVEKIARSAGERTKMAVWSSQAGIDPVGSCIGQKGTRIQAVLNELPVEEKVDVIAFNKSINQFIANALSPAENVKVVSVSDNLATVEVPEDQLALAIGAGGENVRLAGILVDREIKVQAAK